MAFEGWNEGQTCGCRGAHSYFTMSGTVGKLLPDPGLKYYELLPADKVSIIRCPMRQCDNVFLYATTATLRRHRHEL